MTQAAQHEVLSGALSKLRVLDLSRILAGPWASQTLGDLGADVIKIERPKSGDDTRSWGPPFLDHKAKTGDAAYYLCANRNKQSVAIDITTPDGQHLIRELARKSDVLIENFKCGNLAKYGLDYASLKAVNPQLIYCSITGFGQTGPYAHRPGYDFLMQGMSGLMSLSGHPEGLPGSGPMKVGVALTDILTGLYASTAILAAVQAREHTGQGQYIDLGLLDVGVACLANQSMNYFYGEAIPSRMGNGHPNTAPYQDFPTKDGHMILAIGNDQQFERFCLAVGRTKWAKDPRFMENSARLAHRESLIPKIQQLTRTRTTKEWIDLLDKAAVPCGPINTVADVFTDEQVQARGMQISMKHSTQGNIPLVASPIRMSDTPVQYRFAPPTLGQDTQRVLHQILHIPEQQIQALLKDGVIA